MPDDKSLPEDQQETLEDVEQGQMGTGAALSGSDWTTETILNQLNRGNIELDPIFQRRDAWKGPRKSQFIESLVLGLPVPQLVLAERKEKRGSYIVIDGKQRLLSLRQFASPTNDPLFDQLKLTGLQTRKDLNGFSYESLKADPSHDPDLTAFDNQTIRTVVIKAWPTEEFLYSVFLRLNTGSQPLSAQELRQALHPGPFYKVLDEFAASSKHFWTTLNLSEPDFRMRDTELIIRYLAYRNFLTEYRGNLKAILDETAKRFNADWKNQESILKQQLADLDEAIDVTVEVFGQDAALRKWNGEAYEARLNRAVFDIMTFFFDDPKIAVKAKSNKKALVRAFQTLCVRDDDFRVSVEGTTKTMEAVVTRLSKWSTVLRRVLKVNVAVPKLKDGAISI